jgi:hypothetical protein
MTWLLIVALALALAFVIARAARASTARLSGVRVPGVHAETGLPPKVDPGATGAEVVECPDCGNLSPVEDIICPLCGCALAGGISGQPFQAPTWGLVSFAALAGSGARVVQVPYLAIGGGMGSFVWVDHLRVCGVPEEMIRVVGPYARPYRRFQFLCANGQIDLGDPLRSASEARPDNLWGFPGYALSAAWREARRLNLRRAAGYMWQVGTEPDLANTFVPRSGQVYRSVDRE